MHRHSSCDRGALLSAGHPAAALLYYRGGIHDWVTLGLPLLKP